MNKVFKTLASVRCKRAEVRRNFLGALFSISALFWALPEAQAAMPGKIADMEGILPSPKAQAIQTISGSPYPGVIDCLLQRPAQGEEGADIHIQYPSIGNKLVDEDIRGWVSDMADAFINHLDLPVTSISDPVADADAVIESVLSGEDLPAIRQAGYELWGAYRISRPSKAAVSIAFELWNYTGDPEGNLDIVTLNYSLLTGQRLDFVDIFEKPDVALELMSSWARKKLEPRLGAAIRERMLQEGTAPLVENFSSITLIPDGICINFQPWQVAPRDAGIQTVMMPLEELLPSAPLLALWGKGDNPNERID